MCVCVYVCEYNVYVSVCECVFVCVSVSACVSKESYLGMSVCKEDIKR